MSLEAAINKNTAAVESLHAMLSTFTSGQMSLPLPAGGNPANTPISDNIPNAGSQGAKTAESSPPTGGAAAAAPVDPATPTEDDKPVTLQDATASVSKAIRDGFLKREHGLMLMKQATGVESLPSIKDDAAKLKEAKRQFDKACALIAEARQSGYPAAPAEATDEQFKVILAKAAQ